ncbi:MAG TPA: site-specific integrase [Ktedonobacterales bacterium]|jgi:integrase
MASKRGNNEGSIAKRSDGRWMARITLSNGRRKTFYAKTRQEAARLLAAALRDKDKGLPIVSERQTVEHYLNEWLLIIKPTLRESAWQRYEELIRLHITPVIGSVILSRLTAQQLNGLYAAKLEAGLSATTVNYLHRTMHKALADGLRADLVQRNVADQATPPRKVERQMSVLTVDQARAFLAAIRGDRLEALYVLAITAAIRQGELLALRWQDLDLESGFVQIRASHRRMKRRFVVTLPKTARGRRKVALTKLAIDALRRHQESQALERLAAGTAWQDNNLVFPTEVGERMDGPYVYRYHFLRLLERANLPRIRFHDLRHSAATLLLLLGIHPKVVSEMLGHSNISITLDLYSHVLPEMQRDATNALDKLLGE